MYETQRQDQTYTCALDQTPLNFCSKTISQPVSNVMRSVSVRMSVQNQPNFMCGKQNSFTYICLFKIESRKFQHMNDRQLTKKWRGSQIHVVAPMWLHVNGLRAQELCG